MERRNKPTSTIKKLDLGLSDWERSKKMITSKRQGEKEFNAVE